MDSAEALIRHDHGHYDDRNDLDDAAVDRVLTSAGYQPRPDTFAAFTGWRRVRAGRVALEAVPEHRIRIHAAGGPIRGFCGQPFVYTRGDMDLMPAGYADSWREDDDNTSLYVSVTPQLLQRTARDIDIDSSRAQLDLRHQFRDPQIEHISLALDAERRSGFINGNLYTESLSTALAVHLLRRYPAQQSSRVSGLAPMQLRRLRDYIEDNLASPLSLDELAGLLGISSSHLKAQFRKATGVPVHQYVIRRRVERARELLLHSDLPISAVAFEVGFAHQSHMARHMQRQFGVAPAMLRRAAK